LIDKAKALRTRSFDWNFHIFTIPLSSISTITQRSYIQLCVEHLPSVEQLQ
jgi:hypothetical protein